MILLDDALKIHSVLIEKFGGSIGLRDKKLLESALIRPFQTFDKKDLYHHQLRKQQRLLKVLLQIIHLLMAIKDLDMLQ